MSIFFSISFAASSFLARYTVQVCSFIHLSAQSNANYRPHYLTFLILFSPDTALSNVRKAKWCLQSRSRRRSLQLGVSHRSAVRRERTRMLASQAVVKPLYPPSQIASLLTFPGTCGTCPQNPSAPQPGSCATPTILHRKVLPYSRPNRTMALLPRRKLQSPHPHMGHSLGCSVGEQ